MYVYSNIELNNNQIKNGVFHVLGAAPTPGSNVIGKFYYDSTIGAPRFWNGTVWNLLATDSALLNGQNAAYYLNRQYHTGTQTAATISDFATTVKSYPLNTLGKPTANVDMNGFTLFNLSTPTTGGQAAEYQWVLNQISQAIGNGIKAVKDPVRVLIAGNVTLSGIPSSANADGITLVAGDRVLLTGQTNGAENAIWLVQTGAWTRPVDFDMSNDIVTGTEVLVNEGLTYSGTIWRITTTGTLTLGTTALAWQQVNKSNTYTAGNGLTLTGTVFSVKVVANGGIIADTSGLYLDRTRVSFSYKQTIGDSENTTFVVIHGLGTEDVDVTVRDTVSKEIVYPLVVVTDSARITVSFSGITPNTGQFKVKVTG